MELSAWRMEKSIPQKHHAPCPLQNINTMKKRFTSTTIFSPLGGDATGRGRKKLISHPIFSPLGGDAAGRGGKNLISHPIFAPPGGDAKGRGGKTDHPKMKTPVIASMVSWAKAQREAISQNIQLKERSLHANTQSNPHGSR